MRPAAGPCLSDVDSLSAASTASTCRHGRDSPATAMNTKSPSSNVFTTSPTVTSPSSPSTRPSCCSSPGRARTRRSNASSSKRETCPVRESARGFTRKLSLKQRRPDDDSPSSPYRLDRLGAACGNPMAESNGGFRYVAAASNPLSPRAAARASGRTALSQ